MIGNCTTEFNPDSSYCVRCGGYITCLTAMLRKENKAKEDQRKG